MNLTNGFKIFGALLFLAGGLSFIVGLASWNKFWMATGLMACVISGAMLYYVWQQDIPKDKR